MRGGGGKKIEQDEFLIQLCVQEDFPVSRCSLAGLKGPPDQTQALLSILVL